MTTQAQHMSAVLDALAQAGDHLVRHSDLVRQGTQLVLPETMDVDDAIRILRDYELTQSTYVDTLHDFPYLFADGVHSTHAVLGRTFGTNGRPATIQTMFGSVPPMSLPIALSVTETVNLPVGLITFPVLGREATLTLERNGDCFRLIVSAPQARAPQVAGLIRLIEHELATRSIYRGSAIDADGNFLDLTALDPESVVYSQDTMQQLDSNIWSALRDTDLLREHGISVKRAVLLHGPFGSGKTLAGLLTAQQAVANGWTFVMAKAGDSNLTTVLETARLYAPAVVFFEDVDTIANPSAHSADAVSRLLDTFDGIQSKGKEVIAVMTTNHPEKIHRGMVRPGRLDAVVPIGHLDRDGVERLIKVTVPSDSLADDVDYDRVFDAFADMEPAFIKEAIERTSRYSIAANGQLSPVSTDDFVRAADGLQPQLDMMRNAPVAKPKTLPLEAAFADLMAQTVDDSCTIVVSDLLNRTRFVDEAGACTTGDYATALEIK